MDYHLLNKFLTSNDGKEAGKNIRGPVDNINGGKNIIALNLIDNINVLLPPMPCPSCEIRKQTVTNGAKK